MKSKAVFYHAGCPVCVTAEDNLVKSLNRDVESVHLGNQKQRLDEARVLGIQSVPALVLDNQVFHINFGAKLSDLV